MATQLRCAGKDAKESPMPPLPSRIAALVAAGLLAACSNSVTDAFDSRQNVGPCPPAGSIYESARVVELSGGEQYSNITYTGEITGVEMFCRYAGTDPIDAELELTFAFGKGPAGTASAHTYPFFVAVTRRNGAVLAKQSYTVDARFDGGAIDGRTERIALTIPRADETISGANFEVLVGFELTDEQLAFNRAGKRFRLDARQ